MRVMEDAPRARPCSNTTGCRDFGGSASDIIAASACGEDGGEDGGGRDGLSAHAG